MAYLGNNSLPFDPTRTAAQPRDAERFSGNGSTVNFTLSRTVNNPTDVEVFVENVQQEPIVAYNIVGTTLSFTEAPPSGSQNIYVIYRAFNTGAQVYVPDGSITYAKLANNLKLFTSDNLTPNGNNSVFTLSDTPPDANTVIVSVDGIVQRAPVHYTVSGQTITFTSPPPAGSNVHVRHLGIRTTETLTAIAANTFIPQPTISSPTITGTTTISGLLPAAANTTQIGSSTQPFAVGHFNGIKFPGTQSASADANTLDDYEEGTWTPSIQGNAAAGTVTYGALRYGYYTKVGRKVTVGGRIDYSNFTGASGYLLINGLPFTSLGSLEFIGTFMTENLVYPTSSNYCVTYISASAFVIPWGIRDNGAWQTFPVTDTAANIIFTITYFTS